MSELINKTKSPFKNFFYFEKGSVKIILCLIFPLLIELIVGAAFGMIDQMMAGQYSTEALNAIGLYTTPSSIFQVAFTAINVGTTVRVAWNIGAKKHRTARRVMLTSMSLNFLIGIVITAFCMFAAPAAISFLAGDNYGSVHVKGTVASDAVDVFRLCSAGIVFQSVATAVTGSLRGAGENRVPLFYNLAVSFLNVIGNYMFIYGVEPLGIPEMGAQGAALSTALSQVIRCVFAVSYIMLSKHSKLGFKNKSHSTDFDSENSDEPNKNLLHSLIPNPKITKKILSIGIPSAIESLIINFGFVLLAKIIVSTGPESYAAHQITNSINNLFLIAGSAFSSAANTIIGQHIGAKDIDGAKYYVKAISKIASMFSISLMVLLILFARNFVKLYTTDSTIIGISTELLYICAPLLVICVLLSVFSGSLRGAGDTKFPVYVAIVSVLILRVSLAYLAVYVFDLGIKGVWFVTLTDNSIRCIIMFIRYKSGRWQKHIEVDDK